MYIFIVNPKSGNGKALKIVDRISNAIKKEEYRIIYADSKIDTINKIKDLNNCIIYSVGGDGTLNSVVNGIVGTNNALGIINAGTGNDFYRVYKNLPLISNCDVGLVNDKYFINTLCFGVDALVCHNANLSRSVNMYKNAIFRSLINYKNIELECILNGNKTINKYALLTICNGQYYGNGFSINESYSLNDGKLELFEVKDVSKFRLIELLLRLKKSTLLTSKSISLSKIDDIYISSKNNIICNYDGEEMVDKTFKVKVLKNNITLYNNPELSKKINLFDK